MEQIEKAAQEAEGQLLPRKSGEQYKKQLSEFIKWCRERNVEKCTEEKVLLAYFLEKSKKLKASSLWSVYSMIKATIATDMGVDISKFSKLTAFLKRQNEGYKPKKSKILNADNIKDFLEKAPDHEFLAQKVVLIIGVSGACRGMELCQLDKTGVLDYETFFLVNLRDTKTEKDRSFVIKRSKENSTDVVRLVKKYIALRPPSIQGHTRFFVGYRNGKCTSQPMGKNTIGQLPTKIAEYLKLPDAKLYTGHCFRRTSASLLADSGVTLDQLKRHGGWKSSTVAEGYVENSLYQKKSMADQLFTGTSTGTSAEISISSAQSEKPTTSSVPPMTTTATILQNTLINENSISNNHDLPFFHVAHCSGVNINVNINRN